jgi:hypothetical protein
LSREFDFVRFDPIPIIAPAAREQPRPGSFHSGSELNPSLCMNAVPGDHKLRDQVHAHSLTSFCGEKDPLFENLNGFIALAQK